MRKICDKYLLIFLAPFFFQFPANPYRDFSTFIVLLSKPAESLPIPSTGQDTKKTKLGK